MYSLHLHFFYGVMRSSIFFVGGGVPCTILANELDCDIIASEFELQSEQFWTNILAKDTIVEGDSKDPFSIATTQKCRGGCNFFSLDCSTLTLIVTL